MSKAKKKRSQAPVALVYFVTLLVFMAVFGFIAYQLIIRMTDNDNKDEGTDIVQSKDFSLLFARTTRAGTLADAAYLKFLPDDDKVVIVPISAHTLSEGSSSQFTQVYETGGIRNLVKSVEDTFGVSVDHYITVGTDSFETVCDIIGGVVYTPSEELYSLADNDADDISYPVGKAQEFSGRQIAQLLDRNVFSEGYNGNLVFLGDVLEQLVSNAFQQATLTKSSLDNIYTKLTASGELNYTRNDYTLHKSYITEMLERHIAPSTLRVPEGTWRDDGEAFVVSDAFRNELAELCGVKQQTGAAFNAQDNTTTASAAAVTSGTTE